MNIPCLSSAYYKQVETILDVLEIITKEEFITAGQKFQKLIMEENGESDTENVTDAAVSFDGTWAKKGHYVFDWCGLW